MNLGRRGGKFLTDEERDNRPKITGNLIGVLETYLNSWISLRITYDMRNQLFAHLQKMSHQFFMTGKQGDILTRMTGDISGVQQIFSNTLTGILSNSLTLIVAMAMMLSKNVGMALIAIVGPSGSGKSTLMNLIPRLYDPKSGSVTFDGTDLRELDLQFLRDQIGIVTQDTYLFHGTIRDNLLYAKGDATEAELIEACKKANVYDLIQAQDKGFDTLVGNRGLKLSGGEKQRLSIARVLLKDPAVLLFDEATSSLDSISEHLIQEAIDPLIQSRTSIVIAHRLSTILNADEILVLDGGKITERGKHEDLIQTGGLYAHLYQTQFCRRPS